MLAMRDSPKTHVGVVTIEVAELACRLAEAMIDLTRPANLTPREALATLPDDTRDGLLKAAGVAIEYVVEALRAGMAGHVTILPHDDPTDLTH